ncbi:DUF2793 domain-containing protein [Sphingomonas sp. G-3-2-10]|uniref:DUF2793 domain-containing protein n=1 Tax=Sphingomonas sp. G-3-2-10 TaxID=2728838 RepID=UPI00146AEFF4|nr:DUF2793 domain-containing protein [Sphingomonas sp. G-3-2-10]NML07907.1 DUF2793 domain-containing protein [Sphingomonas sp. G-3-2-10]
MTALPTPRFELPLLQPGQAQKEMYHNEALIRLDLAVQATVLAAGANIPPVDPEPGQAWIVGTAPTGDWAGHARSVAGWTAAGWRFLAPPEGMRAWVADSEGFALFTEGDWLIGVSHGRLIVEGEQVVGPRAGAIEDPDGGTTVDSEARSAIAAILLALREHGLVDTP